MASLSEGFCFTSKNLYPVLFPFNAPPRQGLCPPLREWRGGESGGPQGEPAYGMHFVQWSSSIHHHDWHNMPEDDCEVLVRRLAAMERAVHCSRVVTNACPTTAAGEMWLAGEGMSGSSRTMARW
ncbi:MAG: hypothetical protein JRH20_21790 [Deltaproteobacteria bacterium]|nr:hypothetical protein [Deltaproteobacteria bacterium]